MYDNMYYIILGTYRDYLLCRLVYYCVHTSHLGDLPAPTISSGLGYGIFLIRILKYTNKRRLTTVWWYTLVINNEILIL